MSVWNRTAPAGSAPLILVNEITPDKPRAQALVGGAASPRIARASALAETRGEARGERRSTGLLANKRICA